MAQLLNNLGAFNVHLRKEDKWWRMQIEDLVTGDKQDVLSFRQSKKQWLNLEKAIEFANSRFYNMAALTIRFPSGVILYCKREE